MEFNRYTKYNCFINGRQCLINELLEDLKLRDNFFENYGSLLASGCCIQDNVVYEAYVEETKENISNERGIF